MKDIKIDYIPAWDFRSPNKEVKDTSKKNLIITHCNCKERAEYVRDRILEKVTCKKVYIMDTAGVSSMYANDGGIIVTI